MTSIPTRERHAGILKVDTHPWTYDDLRDLPESLDRYEIIDGVLYMSPSPHVSRHQRTLRKIFRLMDDWVVNHQYGEVYLPPADVKLAEDNVFQPDLFVLGKEKQVDVDVYVSAVPDLVVEILSPASIRYDREIKFRAYEAFGVKEYWLVDPEERTVEIFRHTGEQFALHGRFKAGETAASVLLEGLKFQVSTIFSD